MTTLTLRPFPGRLRWHRAGTARLSHVHRLAGGAWKAYVGQRGAKKGQHGWKNTATGRIVYQAQPPKARTPAQKAVPAGKTAKAKRPGVDELHAHIAKLKAEPEITAKHLEGLAGKLTGLTVKELTDLKKKLGLKASGAKSELARKIAERALQKAEKAEKAPSAPAPAPAAPASFQPAAHAGKLVDIVKKAGGPHNHASLVDVRKALEKHGIQDRAQQDQVIEEARKKGLVSASAIEGRHGASPEERKAALTKKGESPLGFLSLREK